MPRAGDSGPGAARRGFLRRRRLIVLAAGLPVAEYVLLQAFGLRDALPLAPQTTALAPIEVFHDLRFLMVFHAGWWTFAAMVAGLVVLRVALTPLFVRLAWPDDVDRPPVRRSTAHGVAFVVLALVLLAPAATVLFTGAIVPLFWFYVAAFVLAVAPILLLHRAAYPIRWWARLPHWRTLAWLALSAVVLTLAGLAIAFSPPWVGVLPVAAAGLYNGLAWYGIADVVAHREAGELDRPAVPLRHAAVAIAVAAVAAGGGFGVAAWTSPPLGPLPAEPSARPVLVVLGFRSSLEPARVGDAVLEGPFVERRYSYRGLGPDGLPLPYEPEATYQPLEVLVEQLRRQVDALHERTGQAVALVAESEGTLVAKLYLLTHPDAPVSELVMASPLLAPGRTFYPPPGEAGFGVATRFAVRREAQLISAVLFPVEADTPILRSIQRRAGTLREGMTCDVPGVREAALLPLSSALAEPPLLGAGIPVIVVPAVHGSLTGGGKLRDAVVLQLGPGRPARATHWQIAAAVVRGSAAAWQTPSLPLGLRSAWQHDGGCPG